MDILLSPVGSYRYTVFLATMLKSTQDTESPGQSSGERIWSRIWTSTMIQKHKVWTTLVFFIQLLRSLLEEYRNAIDLCLSVFLFFARRTPWTWGPISKYTVYTQHIFLPVLSRLLIRDGRQSDNLTHRDAIGWFDRGLYTMVPSIILWEIRINGQRDQGRTNVICVFLVVLIIAGQIIRKSRRLDTKKIPTQAVQMPDLDPM